MLQDAIPNSNRRLRGNDTALGGGIEHNNEREEPSWASEGPAVRTVYSCDALRGAELVCG